MIKVPSEGVEERYKVPRSDEIDNFASREESLVDGPGNDTLSFPVCIGILVDVLINWLILAAENKWEIILI